LKKLLVSLSKTSTISFPYFDMKSWEVADMRIADSGTRAEITGFRKSIS